MQSPCSIVCKSPNLEFNLNKKQNHKVYRIINSYDKMQCFQYSQAGQS